MNLILGILWLLGGAALLGYEFATGERPFSIRAVNINPGWVMLLLAAYNFVRWYGSRMGRDDAQALRIVHEARLRQARTRERPIAPDPTFDFTSNPPPPPEAPQKPIDPPPSNN
jgi:hypothetical protein